MKKTTLARIIFVAALAFWFSLFISGCNTMQGAGKDIQRAGEGVEDAAN
jgi:predicted small secreted protein